MLMLTYCRCFSDEVQLSSEAMGVYELQASLGDKFQSLSTVLGRLGNGMGCTLFLNRKVI